MNTTNNDKNKNTNSLTQLLFERNSQQFKVNYNLIHQSTLIFIVLLLNISQ